MIFVTGGTGLVGKHLLEELSSSGRKVRALHRRDRAEELPLLPGLEWVRGDIMDIIGLEEILEGVEEVYHCAAVVSFQPGEQQQMLRYNVEGTANVVNACLLAGVRKLVFVSSVAAIGRGKPEEPANETMLWTESTNRSVYGKSKYLAEMEVWRGMGEGLNVAIVNPAIILGEGNWNRSSTTIFKNIYKGFSWYTDGVNGFVDVKDVVRAMLLLMNSDIAGQRFILSAKSETYRNLFTLIAEGYGKKPPHRKVSSLLGKLVWRAEALRAFFTRKPPMVTRETTRTAQSKIYYDNSKSLAQIPGFSYTPLDETIQRITAAPVEGSH